MGNIQILHARAVKMSPYNLESSPSFVCVTVTLHLSMSESHFIICLCHSHASFVHFEETLFSLRDVRIQDSRISSISSTNKTFTMSL